MKTLALLGTVTGIALFAGIRLYATVLTVGLCLRYGLLHLPQDLSSLAVLAHPYVLVVAGVCAAMEFLADKVPWVDSLWDAVHAFLRPAGAALIAFAPSAGWIPQPRSPSSCCAAGWPSRPIRRRRGPAVCEPEPGAVQQSPAEPVRGRRGRGGSYAAVAHPFAILALVTVFLGLFALLARRNLPPPAGSSPRPIPSPTPPRTPG